MSYGPQTAALVNIVTSDNVTWEDAVRFDPPPNYTGCTGVAWNMIGQNFRLDIKGDRNLPAPPLLSVTSPNQVIVDDPANRILHFNVSELILTGVTGAAGATGVGLLPGKYDFDFIMFDGSNPPVRVGLMGGKFTLKHGITGG